MYLSVYVQMYSVYVYSLPDYIDVPTSLALLTQQVVTMATDPPAQASSNTYVYVHTRSGV